MFVDLLLDTGAYVVTVGESLASGSFISPEMFECYVFPYQREIAEAAHKRCGLLSTHIWGNITNMMSRVADTGADIIEFDARTDFDASWPSNPREHLLIWQC